jgi:hypothetical protein
MPNIRPKANDIESRPHCSAPSAEAISNNIDKIVMLH